MHGRTLLVAVSVGILTATPLVACQGPVACPAIAAAPFLTIHITENLAARLNPLSVTATACQDNGCHDGPLALTEEQPASPATQSAAAASSSTGKVGRINMGLLTETPIDLTVAGHDLLGTGIGPHRLQFAPNISYPWGYGCPRVVTADATWDTTGLRRSGP
ncbi:hypothetical protein RBS60_18795 [Sinomonas sp. ASV486]|uniref:hypothetical protein n=1 Tax=Sinomonas sp. ASV486 TaxID=3051170 RepID=UPI0027DDCEEF|nr:hypothetical protein [Sinomonas sp. ASV486]MDQ4492253.1 hypothetical protein [Sinomonas sp. ASV486]